MPAFDSLQQLSLDDNSTEQSFTESVIQDFWICCVSREVSLLGRREVLTGKAKFGILGDGKEVPQVAMARAWKKGDWRSGYYRDQTLVFALGLATVEEYFAQLYADSENDPWSGGRQMNAHFATHMIDGQGAWTSHMDEYNVSSDISPTGGQMGRALGLALASKHYRARSDEFDNNGFTKGGNEVCFCTIGDASTSEGVFWETMNAAAVTQVPLAVSVWDDGYGISVPRELQTAKGSISKAMSGMASDDDGSGLDIYTVKAWDYPGLCALYERAIARVRETHIPALIHVEECTQPQGHSTSGSHERYKSKERLEWEEQSDCIAVMAHWMITTGITTEEEVADIKARAKKYVRECKQRSWANLAQPVLQMRTEALGLIAQLPAVALSDERTSEMIQELEKLIDPQYAEVLHAVKNIYYALLHTLSAHELSTVKDWIKGHDTDRRQKYSTHLYSDHATSALRVPVVTAQYDDSKPVNSYQVLNAFFDRKLEDDPRIVAFGEDVGHIGDVNQGFAGLQQKHGNLRVFDTGIREWTIMGQAIGLSMRGFRPIAEIQYLDYLVYGLPPLTDDLATIRYRSNGIQQAPAIIRTRGHRLEGIWHTGSPLGMVINSLRGLYVCVPRNMVQAAGMYATLLKGSDPAIVIECLNGYRRKERMPSNLGEFTVPLGVPEVLRSGSDVTIVSYGSVLHEVQKAADVLEQLDVDVEIIDVQTLLPFDLEHTIVRSLEKTSRVVFVDEDVPGGASAFMMREVLEIQQGYQHLDTMPICITASDHRSAYGSDGDYFTKPNSDDIVERVYIMMQDGDPGSYPAEI